MSPKFGTSGLRGLVAELTPDLVADHVRAFLATCDHGGTICLGIDLRPSSPDIAKVVAQAAQGQDVNVIDCGAVPTPALALMAQDLDAGAVMVTGSHIPADRNGLKFYTRSGEIGKSDEAAIVGSLGGAVGTGAGGFKTCPEAEAKFVSRYVSAFGPNALEGRRVGLYSHSAVGRDSLAQVLTELGAEVVEIARSDTFIPVDTEAVDPETRAQLRDWVDFHQLDAIASTDGDSDRPMLTDETGRVIPGDILGQITAAALGAQTVVTPISSNSGVAMIPTFEKVVRTLIGSPHVIAAMQAEGGRVAGYEANGGFLLGFAANGPAGPLSPLPTRDSFLPIVAVLVEAGAAPLSARVAQEPPRFTAADRLQDVPSETGAALVDDLANSPSRQAGFMSSLDLDVSATDLTDGSRMTADDGTVVHLRPSGNAPELRVYVEAATAKQAEDLLTRALACVRAEVTQT